MTRGLRRIATKFGINGRRGAFQLLFAAAYLCLGLSYVALPSSPGRERSLTWLTSVIPLDALGWLWIIGAVAGILGSRMARPKDRRSFSALTLVPSVWGFLYLVSVFTGHNPFGWITTAMYWCIAGAVMCASGMNGDTDRDDREIRAVTK